MYHYRIALLLLFVTALPGSLPAQGQPDRVAVFNEWEDYFDRAYGVDYNLVNGIRYLYPYARAHGHPFLGENRFYTGYAVINGHYYQDLLFKYDICNQQLILNHTFLSGGTEQIIINYEIVDEYELEGKLFRRYSFTETGTKIFQVIESGNLSCLYTWTKEFEHNPTSSWNVYSFTSSKKKRYLLIDDQLFPFLTKRSFLKVFPEEYKKEINQYIRKNHIWLKEAPDNVMQQLIVFCDQIIQPGND